ncbi:MAG: GNAT family N-acetyltransferase, partial [Pseudomonadales bacterium]
PAGTVGVFAFDTEKHKLVGFARVFSDEIFTTYISEVCVSPACQGNGIGTNLVQAICQRFLHTAIFVESFESSISIFNRNHIIPKGKLVACGRAPSINDLKL